MSINDPPTAAGTRELKVKIPVNYHLQLHQLKILEGRRIHGVIEEALDLWFQKLDAGDAGLLQEHIRESVPDLAEAEQAALERLPAQQHAHARAPFIPPPAPGVTLQKRYELRSLLGRGSYGQACLALDSMLERKVVVKLLNEAFLPESEGKRLFLKEARLLASLEHPRVIHVYDFGFHGSTPFYVMEYADGGSLAQLAARGPLPLCAALRIVDDILQGLEYVHSHGILHRDLKPGNILLNKRQEAKIADFGLALRDVPSDATSADLSAAAPGTPAYAAPETLRAEPLTPASDVYAVGVILFELIAGRFYMQILQDSRTAIKRAIEPGGSREEGELAKVVRSMLERKPERRLQTATEARRAVRSLMDEHAFDRSRLAASSAASSLQRRRGRE